MNYDVKLSITDKKYYGSPPAIKTNIVRNDDVELSLYYTWHSRFFDVAIWKEWVASYMGATYTAKEISYYNSSPNYMTTNTMGVNAKLCMLGHTLPADILARFHNDIKRCIEFSATRKVVKKPETVEKPKPAFNQLIADIEDELDKLYNSNYSYKFSLYEFLTKRMAPKPAAQEVITYYNPILIDVKKYPEDFSGKKKEYKLYVLFLSSMIEDAKRYIDNKVMATRKPVPKKTPKQKAKAKSELIKKLSYKKENTELKLVSIPPESIIGAKTLITYNDKYKVITMLIAAPDQTLSVRGTTVINLDETQSLSKKLKKSVDLTTLLMGNDKAIARKLSDIDTKNQEASGRINSDTILLKVFT